MDDLSKTAGLPKRSAQHTLFLLALVVVYWPIVGVNVACSTLLASFTHIFRLKRAQVKNTGDRRKSGSIVKTQYAHSVIVSPKEFLSKSF